MSPMFPPREPFTCSTNCRNSFSLYIMPCILVWLLSKTGFPISRFQSGIPPLLDHLGHLLSNCGRENLKNSLYQYSRYYPFLTYCTTFRGLEQYTNATNYIFVVNFSCGRPSTSHCNRSQSLISCCNYTKFYVLSL